MAITKIPPGYWHWTPKEIVFLGQLVFETSRRQYVTGKSNHRFFCSTVDSSADETLNLGGRCASKTFLIWRSCQGRTWVEAQKSKHLSTRVPWVCGVCLETDWKAGSIETVCVKRSIGKMGLMMCLALSGWSGWTVLLSVFTHPFSSSLQSRPSVQSAWSAPRWTWSWTCRLQKPGTTSWFRRSQCWRSWRNSWSKLKVRVKRSCHSGWRMMRGFDCCWGLWRNEWVIPALGFCSTSWRNGILERGDFGQSINEASALCHFCLPRMAPASC